MVAGQEYSNRCNKYIDSSMNKRLLHIKKIKNIGCFVILLLSLTTKIVT
ncbi:hypothetical protein HMPREF3226_02467 [Prevotella corporis]|uniref:Uncharacterized protein n=1 Tax=Prevotella corporis TaxID=28128 RepID=A0A133PVQ7_9BACT|nr:hypothetical protein HMPREF3226_02467 [Prevotella corporis]